jgi:papain like cysteine protease AvrRpt2
MNTKSVSVRAVAASFASLGLGLMLAAPSQPQTPKTQSRVQIQSQAEVLRAVKWVPPPIVRLGTGEQLAVPLLGQETNVWCWDASSLMVIKYFRPATTLTECQIATQATPSVGNCCTTPFPAACVHPGWEMLSKNGFSSASTSTALSWADLKTQISTQKKPVLFAWGWNGGGGHMLVATGWFTLAGQQYVRVNNPWPPTSGTKESYTYAAWVGGPGYDHITWDNWYNIVDNSKPIRFNPHLYKEYRVQPLPGPDPIREKLVVHPEVLRRATTTLDEIRTAPPELSRELGFAAGEDAKQAQLGTPLREYNVHLDSLRGYTPNVAAAKLLTGGTTLFYPVVTRGAIRSSVRVSAPTPETAKTLSIGDTVTAGHLQLLEPLAPQLRTAGGSPVPAVRIPALGLYFVARPRGESLEVASIFDVPAYGLKRGSYESLETVLARLAPIAKALPEGVM